MLVAKLYGWFLRVLDEHCPDDVYGAVDVDGVSAKDYRRYRRLMRDEQRVVECESVELGPSVSVGELVGR